MSAEISYQSQMRLGNGSLVDAYSNSSQAATQNVAFLVRNVQSIPTLYNPTIGNSWLDLGGVITPGFAVFVNLDAVNFIQVGTDVGGPFPFVPFLKLKAGEISGPMRIGTATIAALANTLAVKLFYIIYND